jgi:hypothetical protein
MNVSRRGFLRLFGGGIAASATMAEAGMLSELLDWIRRKPVSFAAPRGGWKSASLTTDDLYDLEGVLDAAYKPALSIELLEDSFFDIEAYLRRAFAVRLSERLMVGSGGPEPAGIIHPFRGTAAAQRPLTAETAK